jgi:hypothetical protein
MTDGVMSRRTECASTQTQSGQILSVKYAQTYTLVVWQGESGDRARAGARCASAPPAPGPGSSTTTNALDNAINKRQGLLQHGITSHLPCHASLLYRLLSTWRPWYSRTGARALARKRGIQRPEEDTERVLRAQRRLLMGKNRLQPRACVRNRFFLVAGSGNHEER